MSMILLAAAAAFLMGLALVKFFLTLLPKRLRQGNALQRNMRLKEAEAKAKILRDQELMRAESRLSIMLEDFEAQASDKEVALVDTEKEIELQEGFAEEEEARIAKLESERPLFEAKVEKAKNRFEDAIQEVKAGRGEVAKRLSDLCGKDPSKVKEQLVADIINERQINATKSVRLLTEEIGHSLGKMAGRVLSTIDAMYLPEFYWPKGSNQVEISDLNLAKELEGEPSEIIEQLTELSDQVQITFEAQEGRIPIVRFGGGYGISREAAKYTIADLNLKKISRSDLKRTYQTHIEKFNAEAIKLGRMAAAELQLGPVAEEVLRMVGALNWRTSYRQNQFYHSLEVAKLAGILALELGVDPEQAKRSGLLHDIGKGIDYRIDGSHAVISGDYADRFGESKIVCDAVMSHHADVIIESPLAYVLRAADTLSGARPGARVNLEEGYQDRLSSIVDVVRAFPGVAKVEIMNGAREVHVEVHHKKVQEGDLASLSSAIARKIEQDVAFPGQIRVMVARRFEVTAVA